MQLNKTTLITIAITLLAGMAIGALFLGGGSPDPVLAGHEGEGHELTKDENGQWTCSMHPQVRQDEPGSCPFCGMDLIPVSTDQDSDPTVLKMSNAAVQLANIQTVVIGSQSAQSELQLNGRIKPDERQIQVQTTHFAGRIERLYKNFEGSEVRKGEKIASIYSPQLVAAQEELIEAKKLEKSNPVLLEAARKKLRYWKLSDEQVAQIENAQEPMRNFDLLADFDGVVTKRMVSIGDHLHEGEGLLEITNLDQLWVMLEVYEKDLHKLRLGEEVDIEVQGLTIPSKVSFISPQVDPDTRIVEVRAEIGSRNGLLKPDMLVQAQIQGAVSDTQLAVPKSAVLWTGKRSIVYIKSENPGSFELREVTLGPQMGESYSVESGLEAGDEVVTNGAFTIDAEAQLQGKASMMTPITVEANPEDQEFNEVILPTAQDFQEQTDNEFRQQLGTLALAYLQLKDLMVEGNASPIRKSAVQVKQQLEMVNMSLVKEKAYTHWMTLLEPMSQSLETITTTGDRDVQRLQFINLSKALINAVQSFGTSIDNPLYIQFCPMANNDKGATWLSSEEEIINPYFGDVMLNCGNVEDIILNEE